MFIVNVLESSCPTRYSIGIDLGVTVFVSAN